MLFAAGDVKGALANYQKSLVLREALVQAEPGRLDWQCGVASSSLRIADALLRRRRQGALANYQKSLVISEALALADPSRRNGSAILHCCSTGWL